MTKEEIINQLNLAIGLIKQDGKDWLDDRDIPMLEECVKALSQEQDMTIAYLMGKYEDKEPCDDAISREAALKECHDIVVDGERYRVIQEETLLGLPPIKPQADCENCSKCEDAFMRGHDVGLENGYKQGERDVRYESVTQKPKTGHWRKGIAENGVTTALFCTVCGFEDDGCNNSNYCPNCGAKMERSDKE